MPIFICFRPKVERYRNYSDGSRIGPDMFYDYGHFQYIYPAFTSFPYDALEYISSFEFGLIPTAFDIPGSWIVNPEYQYYEDGWFCYHFRERESINVNAVIKKRDGTSYHGDDFLRMTQIPGNGFLVGSIAERLAQFEKDKYDFYGIDEYGYKKYRESVIYSKEEEELLNMCHDVPDVSSKPFPKEERGLSAGWYFGKFYFKNPENYHFTSRYIASFFNSDDDYLGMAFYSSNEISLQYLVIDGRIIHFVDLCDYKSLGSDVTVKRTEYGYLFRFEYRINLYGYNMKLIYDHELATIAGDHVEYDLRDYHEIDKIDYENIDASRSNDQASRSTAPITIHDSGKTVEIDTSLPESVRNISKSRTLNY